MMSQSLQAYLKKKLNHYNKIEDYIYKYNSLFLFLGKIIANFYENVVFGKRFY